MATMVPPTEESKLREKNGQEPLAQATNMVIMASIFTRFNPHQVTAYRIFNGLFLYPFLEHRSNDLGALGL